MAWDRELEDLATTTVIYAAPTTMDAYGAMVASTASVSITARIEHHTKVVVDSIGREVVSQTQLYLKPTTTTSGSWTPSLGGTFTLPSGNVPASPPIIRVSRVDDAISEGGGAHHWEVAL